MKVGRRTTPRYVFVGGLHRSGTSLVNRLVQGLPGIGGITGAPVPENEGVYLQGAIPHTAQSGRPMFFATNPDEHLTEDHPLNALETRLRLDHDWDPWFADGLTWRVEKSPVNLTRMRLLQQLFPLAQFIIVVRHPEAIAASVASWLDQPAAALHQHWVDAHRQLMGDLPYIHAVLVVRYEDIVADTGAAVRQLAAFLDTTATGPTEVIRDGNAAYTGASSFNSGLVSAAADWGYAPELKIQPFAPIVQHPLRAVREAVLSAGIDG